MTSGYPPPPPPPTYKPTLTDRWNRLKLWQKVVIPIAVVLTLAVIISAAFSSDPEPTEKAKDEPTSEPSKAPTSDKTSASDPKSYEVTKRDVTERDDMDSQEVDMEVAVYSDDDLEGMFEKVVNEETDEPGAYRITLYCGLSKREQVLVTGRAANGTGFAEAATGVEDGRFEAELSGEKCGK